MKFGPRAHGTRPMGQGPWAPAQSPATDNSEEHLKRNDYLLLRNIEFHEN